MSFSNWGTFLQKALPTKKIDSAGTNALIGHKADDSAIKIAEKHGISLAEHVGRQFTSFIGRQYDLILVMERYHIEKIGQIAPELRGKTMLLANGLTKRNS